MVVSFDIGSFKMWKKPNYHFIRNIKEYVKWYKALLLIVIIPLVFFSLEEFFSLSHYDLETFEDYTRNFIYFHFAFLCYFFVIVSGAASWQEYHRSDTALHSIGCSMILIFPFTNVYVHYLIKVMSAKQLRSCFFSKNPFGSLTIPSSNAVLI